MSSRKNTQLATEVTDMFGLPFQESEIEWNASTATEVCRTGGRTMSRGMNMPSGIRPVSSSCSRKVLNSSTILWHDFRTSTDQDWLLRDGTFLPQYLGRRFFCF